MYLIQSPKDIQNCVGLKDQPEVKLRVKSGCPHRINLGTPLPEGMSEIDDDLLRYLAPTLKAGPESYFIEDSLENMELVYYMINMFSPIASCVVPLWALNEEKLRNDLYRSNISTVVITDVDKNPSIMNDLAKVAFYAPAKLLFMGGAMTPIKAPIKTLKPKIKLTDDLKSEENWRRLGAKLLREYMLTTHI